MKRFAKRSWPLYVEILIDAPIDRIWELTQTPELHSRWDGRFSSITPAGLRDDGAQKFSYKLKLPLLTIRGTGVSIGEKHAENGSRTSALLFYADSRVSPLTEGRGYWRYIPEKEGVRFITGYDYKPGWGLLGKILDPLVTRRFIWWLTAWSFDRLRIWAETGIEPKKTGWCKRHIRGSRASAKNCLSKPPKPVTEPESLNKIERYISHDI